MPQEVCGCRLPYIVHMLGITLGAEQDGPLSPRSCSAAGQATLFQVAQGTAARVSAELLPLLSLLLPPPTGTKIDLRPYESHVPVMYNFQADLRL